MATFKNQNKIPLKNKVSNEIQKAILDGRLEPGQRLNEAKIASEMGLSKSPVREAIKELTADGILIAEPYKGTYVKGLSRKEAYELFTLRKALETFAIELILPEFTPKDMALLEGIIDKMKTAMEKGRQKRLSELDMEFHRSLIKISGHDLLSEIWDKIAGRVKLYIHRNNQIIGDLDNLYILHDSLYKNICKKDIELAKGSIREHLDHSLDETLTVLNGK
ncbi:MAG: GntR family transcriptional regulator [Desulfobacterales bacterium]|nr:GntR family transcriptional regulator [Desulfobacterales bacterium]